MAPTMPAAEVTVDVPLLQALLLEQHPDLASLSVAPLAYGWDNVLFRLGTELVARLPRRAAGVPLVVHEQRWLPTLAPRLPLPVPVPQRTGRPGCGYPWPWTIAAYLPGAVAATSTADAEHAAPALARFLAHLHRTAPDDAPPNEVRGVPLAHRATRFEEHLADAAGLVDPGAVRDRWEESLAAPAWDRPAVWLHGDLHPANVLVQDGRVSAVIDFGDVTAGDPATDLGVAWMMLPARDRRSFWAVYAAEAGHPVDRALQLRARGWALAIAVACLAGSADNAVMHGVGNRTVAAVLADPA